jgi:hypothetical protein
VTPPQGATSAAIEAYRRAIGAGVDRQVALEVALAKPRASYPGQAEWTLRSWLTGDLAEAGDVAGTSAVKTAPLGARS